MSTLYWLRVARKAKLYRQPEYPSIEALLETEANEPSDEFRWVARIVPGIIAGVGGLATVIGLLASHNAWYLGFSILFGVLAAGTWYGFDYLDRRIPRSRQILRKHAKALYQKMCGFLNIVGVDPALSPLVAGVVEEASTIYLKHRPPIGFPATDGRYRASTALEEAMGRMLELAALPNPRAQEMELGKGWPSELLGEMRQMDAALDAHAKAMLGNPAVTDDPLAHLRQARMELQGVDSAIQELDQGA